MGREKLEAIRDDIKALARELKAGLGTREREIQAVYQRLVDLGEQLRGQLAEFGNQIFGIHVVQEMLIEKAGISPDDVKVRIDARQKAVEEQERILAEKAAEARERAMAVKTAAAETTDQPAPPAEETGGEAPAENPDQPNQQG